MKCANNDMIDLQMAIDHGLSENEYHLILKVLNRLPTLEELGVFSVMWSEHCSYKSSRSFLRHLPSDGERILQGPGENAGIIDIGDGIAAVFKIESHNHPSFIEPYHGAATGVGGILRDVFTMGARPVALLNSLRFGSASLPRTAELIKGVVAGIGGYGNSVGVPTVGGEVYFHEGYNGNILVNAFALGLVQKDKIFKATAAGVGNPVIYVGSLTGKDGIHGASLLASREFDEKSEDLRPAVQVGDPFTENVLIEACLELMQDDLIIGIQDMGAAGLTSSSVEMAARGKVGIELDLDTVPTREKHISAYEMLLSESQERMLLVAKEGKAEAVKAVFRKWDLQAAVVGKVTDKSFFTVKSNGSEVVNIPVPALTSEAPRYERPVAEPVDMGISKQVNTLRFPVPLDHLDILTKLLKSPNLASKQWVYRQYDSFVGSNTIVGPGSDAAIIRLKESDKAIAISVDCNSRYCSLDPYQGAAIAVAESSRNLAVSGATAIALSDCLNFGNPEKPEVMWQFAQTIDGMRAACQALDVAVVSGNVSFYNETDGAGIPPTPTIAMVGILDHIGKRVTQWFKEPDDLIILLGKTLEELGASEYLARIHGEERGEPPTLDLGKELLLQQLCRNAAEAELLASSHDVAEGGLAVSLAECCMTNPNAPMGARVELKDHIRPDALLFGESQSRVIVSVSPAKSPSLKEMLRKSQVPFFVLGRVGGSMLEIVDYLKVDVASLTRTWQGALAQTLSGREN